MEKPVSTRDDAEVELGAAIGQRLRGARRARGLTQQEVADVLGVARTTLVAIEKGERRARAGELVQLAQIYDQPLNVLLRAPRADDGLVVAFRASPGAPSPALHSAVVELQQLAEDYLALEDVLQAPLQTHYPPPRSFEAVDPVAAGQELAATEPNRLGLGDAPIRDLRELLEAEIGLRIFAPPLPSDVAGVYAYAEGVGGCIAVNGHHPRERQLWTIAHDYAHFLTERDRPEATLVRRYERRPRPEQLADAFAEHFLMPSAGLTRRSNDSDAHEDASRPQTCSGWPRSTACPSKRSSSGWRRSGWHRLARSTSCSNVGSSPPRATSCSTSTSTVRGLSSCHGDIATSPSRRTCEA